MLHPLQIISTYIFLLFKTKSSLLLFKNFSALLFLTNYTPLEQPPALQLTYLILTSIKIQVKTFFWLHFLIHFDSSLTCTFHVVYPCDKCSQLPVRYKYAPQSQMSLWSLYTLFYYIRCQKCIPVYHQHLLYFTAPFIYFI